MTTTSLGNVAESVVSEELKKLKYKILELNWRTPYAEIDIIASKNNTIYFIEVKFRGSSVAGDGFDYITKQKIHHMARAAEAWVASNNYQGPYELMAAAVAKKNDEYLVDLREV